MIDIHTWKDEPRSVLNSALHIALIYADEVSTCYTDSVHGEDKITEQEIAAISQSETVLRHVLKSDCIPDEFIVPISNALVAARDILADTECSEATGLTAAAFGLPPQWSLHEYLERLDTVVNTIQSSITAEVYEAYYTSGRSSLV